MRFAQIGDNNLVVNVLEADDGFIDSQGGTFVQSDTASIGDTYRADLGGFVRPSPFPSWILNEATCQYEAPSAMPQDGHRYLWSEENQTWEQQPF